MEATHFIEVWKDGQFFHQTHQPYEIRFKNWHIKSTIEHGLETIAVWRIKPTDVPLQERMAARKMKELEKDGYIVDLGGSYSFNQDLGIINIEEELAKIKIVYAD